ncbi:MAG TPA: FAD-binding oxidoreductase [Solirubrobacteraceae bacterium]|jgi:FAD/FMN-containing dehydrogenase|nr:FAD-binding oxidoreductase [Solirubrobacteraceae bacterium]
MLTTETTAHDVDALRARMAGQVVAEGDEGYEAARLAWNLTAPQRPPVVVIPETAADVVAAVRFAREHGLRVAAQGTGHNAGPLGDAAGTVLVKTHLMRGVEIDAERRIARVEAGALWIDVAAPASEHGLAALAGSSPDVGVVGYSLGGGMGWLARKLGLATNSVTAIELVTADGRLIRADEHQHSDLFWALRGGGGNFGVVTAMELRLYAIPSIVGGAMIWPAERGREVLHAWREWTATAPDEVTTSARLMNIPDMEGVPDMVRGRSLVVIDGAVTGSAEEAAEILAPLRALEPEIDMFAQVPPVALSRIHMDPEEPVPADSETAMLDALPAEAVDALAERFESSPLLLLVELRHAGGALGRTRQSHGALARIDAGFVFFAAAISVPEVAAPVREQLEAARAAVAPYANGRSYANFTEDRADAATFYGAATYERLRAVKHAYDPANLFRANHEIA